MLCSILFQLQKIHSYKITNFEKIHWLLRKAPFSRLLCLEMLGNVCEVMIPEGAL
jgi:hypothetical protein